jgi:hypothetical protein
LPNPFARAVLARVAGLGVNGVFGTVDWYAFEYLHLVVCPAFPRYHVAPAHAPALLLGDNGATVVEVEPSVGVLVAHPGPMWLGIALPVVLFVSEQRVCDTRCVLVSSLVPCLVLRLLQLRAAIWCEDGIRLVRDKDAIFGRLVIGSSGLRYGISHR